MPLKGIAYYEAQMKIMDQMNELKIQAVKNKAENKINELVKKHLGYKKYCEAQIQMLKEKSLDS